MNKKAEPMISQFDKKLYAALKQVPRGRVTTYKELARAVHSRAYRAVGQAMGRNPFAPKVPCHRVVRSDGSLGGYSGGLKRKVAILKREGVKISGGRVSDFKSKFYRF